MGLLRELLAIDGRQALAFFVQHLQEVSESSVDRQELLYTASLLAHFAQVSPQSDVDWSAPTNLSALFDYFVSDAARLDNGQIMEMAGAQCLLLAGFFEDQMRRRHNIRWYAKLGAIFSVGRPFKNVPLTKHDCLTRSRCTSSPGVGATHSWAANSVTNLIC